MPIYPQIRLRYPFEVTEVAGGSFAVGLGSGDDAFHGIVSLKNESAVFMFKKLQEGTTLPDLIVDCMHEYDNAPVEEIGPKVIAFLDTLKEQNLLLVDPLHGTNFVQEE